MIAGRFRPLRDCGQSLDTDRCGDGASVSAAAVRVQILMDLEREIVRGVLNAGADDGVIVRARPRPCPVPVAARHQDLLRHRPGAADCRDGGVRRPKPCARRLIMRLVHQSEHDVGIGLVMDRELAPQIREGRVGCLRASDQRTEAVAIVVRLDFDLQALAGRVAHHVVEPAELHGIERCVLAVLDAFPQKRQPNHAHALGGVVIDLGVRGIGIVGAENARHIGTEFSPGEIDSEKKRAGHGSLRRYLERCRRPDPTVNRFRPELRDAAPGANRPDQGMMLPPARRASARPGACDPKLQGVRS